MLSISTAGLAAQNATLPSQLVEQEFIGGAYEVSNYQWPGRTISLYSPPESGLRKGRVIVGLYLRPWLFSRTQRTPAALRLVVSTRVSSGAVDPAKWWPTNPPSSWGSMEGSTLGPWSSRQVLDFPAVEPGSRSPWVPIPLAAPHPLVIDGSVAVDIKFWSPPSTGFLALEGIGPRHEYGIMTRHGFGCPRGFGTTARSFAVPRGGPYRSSAATASFGLQPGDWELAWVGFNRNTTALPLNFNGDTCFLHVTPHILFPVAQPVMTYGGHWFEWIPEASLANRTLLGAVLWFQHLGLTPRGEVKLSTAIRTQITDIYAPRGSVSVHGSGPNPDIVPVQTVSDRSLIIGLLTN
jgi:hypothetical protein